MRRRREDDELKTARHLSDPEARRVAMADLAKERSTDAEWDESRRGFDMFSISVRDVMHGAKRFRAVLPKCQIFSIDTVKGKLTR